MSSQRQRPPRNPSSKITPQRFDPRSFLATAGIGKVLRHYVPKEALLSQGGLADTVFYIQTGRVRLAVFSKQGREATIALLGPR